MMNDQRPAVVYLRMSPYLRDALRDAADKAGCSLNAFAVQVLAAAAGDPSRFRSVAEEAEPRTLERDALGYPLRAKERSEHIGARSDFIGTMGEEVGAKEMVALVKRHDAEDPGYFVEWQRLRNIERGVTDPN
jgi:hypothetical protein